MKYSSAAVVLGAAFAAHGAAAADSTSSTCPPAARLAGDAELGHAVALELSILGVASADVPAGCPAVDVVVARSGDGVAVSLRDGAGREAAEVVTDASVAASWIESWVHPEIGAPLLAARAAPGMTAPAVAAPAAEVTAARPPAARPGRFAYRGLVLGAAGEMTSASDDSDWRALSASLCARFGVLCAGLTARGADNRGTSMDGGLTEANRYELSLVATVSASLELGRMRLVPSAGLGLAYTETGRGAGTKCISDADPSGQACEAPYAIDDAFTAYSLGPRAEVGLTGAFPIAGPLALTLGVGMSFAPTARGEPAMPDYAQEYFDAIENGDPDRPPADGTMDIFYPKESYQLPAEPSRFTRISLGLAWEIEVKSGVLVPFRSPRGRGKPSTVEEPVPPRTVPSRARDTITGDDPVGLLPVRPIEELSDEALVAACATGDTAALAALFDRHHAVVFRFVSRVSSACASDVEDLAQSTFLEMWRSSPRFRQSGSARSWILGIAANLVRHYVRGEIRRRTAMADLAGQPAAGRAGRPDELAARSELIQRLAAALDALPHDLRVAFVLCDVEEVPGVDAARALGIRQGTMWRRLHDARKRLRDMMGGHPPHEGSSP